MHARLPERPLGTYDLVTRICSWSPELRAARRMHLDRHGKLDPNAFMGDVLARVRVCAGAMGDAQSPHRAELEAILGVLDSCARLGDEQARKLTLAFMDDATSEPFFAPVWPMLGPSLRAQRAAPA